MNTNNQEKEYRGSLEIQFCICVRSICEKEEISSSNRRAKSLSDVMSEVLHSVGLYGKVWNTLFTSLALQLVETSLVAQIVKSLPATWETQV